MSVLARLRAALAADLPDPPIPEPARAHAVQALLWSGPHAIRHWQAPVTIRWKLAGPDDPVAFAPAESIEAPDRAFARAVRMATLAWERVAAVDFVEVRHGSADVLVGVARFPDWRADIAYTVIDADGADRIRGGEVWLDADIVDRPQPGTLGHLALLHEFGHVLGLDHPLVTTGVFPVALDGRRYTVMSYTPADLTGPDGRPLEPATPMPYDIATVQTLYGTPEVATGNDVYRLSARRPQLAAVWDGGGHDRLDAGGTALPVEIDLREGGRSRILAGDGKPLAELVIGFGAAIEDARGGRGDDRLRGNALDNRLRGGRGDDLLIGDGGNDRLEGGRGDDVLIGGAGHDRLIGGGGIDLAVVDGAYADFLIEGRGRRFWLVDLEHADGDAGRDRLVGVERVLFDDGLLVFDPAGPTFHPDGAPALEALLAPFEIHSFVG